MTSYLDLDILKRHLNIDDDFHDDDEYILILADVAVRSIENHIDCPISQFVEDGQLDPPLEHAARLLVGTYYQNRESVTYGSILQVPQGYEYLLHPYINYESRTLCNSM